MSETGIQSDFLERIAEYKQRYWGLDDEDMKIKKYNYENPYTESYSHTRITRPENPFSLRSRYVITLNPGQEVKSIFIEETHLECVEINLAGMRVDRICRQGIMDPLRKLYDMHRRRFVNGKLVEELPFQILKYGVHYLGGYSIEIQVERSERLENPELHYEVFNTTITDKLPSESLYTFPFFRVQFTGEDTYSPSRKVKLRLNFVEPTYYLLIRSDGYEGGFSLVLDNASAFKLEEIMRINNYRIVALTPSLRPEDLIKYGLNFTQIDRAILIPDDLPLKNTTKLGEEEAKELSIEVHAISHFEMRTKDGMVSYGKW